MKVFLFMLIGILSLSVQTLGAYKPKVVTSSAANVRVEGAFTALKSGATAAVTESTGDWINGSTCSVSSEKRTCSFNSGIWSATPTCQCTSTTDGYAAACKITALSTSSITIVTHIPGIGDVDAEMYLTCVGKR